MTADTGSRQLTPSSSSSSSCEEEKHDVIDEHRIKKDPRKMIFKVKQFHVRESLLTQMYQSSANFNVAYNFMTGVFVLFFLRATIDDLFNHKMPLHHLWLVLWNFEQLPSTMLVWSLIFASTFIPYIGMKYWAHIPSKTVTASTEAPVILLYLVYLASMFYFPLKFLFVAHLNCACCFIITCETTRLAMKLHSFIRENVPRAVQRKLSGQVVKPGEQSDWPTAEQFVYFLFCPSFIYRDQYPRTEKTDWGKVRAHAVHVFLCIEYVNLVFTQMIHPWLSSQDPSSSPATTQLLALFTYIPAGLICLLCLFYGLLHSWLNMFSEILTFGDREFYLNWWNASSMAEYYRNWNLVVHDWLYAYIYRDVSVLIGGRKGLQVAQAMVFFASAAFHEYWFGVSLRVFYPVMFMLYFVFGSIFFSVSRSIKNKSASNAALWFNLLIGTGMFVAFYAQEWYARQKCLPYESSIADSLLPRHWTCKLAR